MALDEAKEALIKFNRLKNSQEFKKTPNTHTDILAYDWYGFLVQMAEMGREQLSKKEQKREVEHRRQKYLDEGCELLTEQRGYAFFKITTPEAAVLMGEGSHWCTKNESQAKNYLRRGPLYVITQETEGGNYGSDRYAQFSIPNGPEGIALFECQDVDGNDFGQKEAGDRCYYFDNDTYWWLVEVLENYDKTLAFWVKQGYVFNDYDDMHYFPRCTQCEEYMDEDSDDLYYDTGGDGPFCSKECFISYYSDKIAEEIARLYHPDTSQNDKIDAELEFYINSPESPERNYFQLIDKARHINQPETADEKWTFATQLSNARGGARSSQEKIDKVIPGLKKEDAERVYNYLDKLMEQRKDTAELIENADDYVKEKFSPDNMNVEAILREGGYLGEQSHVSSLLKKKAVKSFIESSPTDESIQDEEEYGDTPVMINQHILDLIEELDQFKSGYKDIPENQLIAAFLRESEVWKKLSQHLNSQNRQLVLKELSREGSRKEQTNVRSGSQMGDGSRNGQ
jgi:hypothetical protein